MANFTFSHALINASFKSLSILTVAIAACRLAFQYDADAHRVDYVAFTFWLVVEAAVAVIAASTSSYRIVVIDYLTALKSRQDLYPAQPRSRRLWGMWKDRGQQVVAKITTPTRRPSLHSSLELSTQQPAQPQNSAP